MKKYIKSILIVIILILVFNFSITNAHSLLKVFQGGTGLGSYFAGDILIATSTNTLYALSKGSDGQVLKLSGGLPAWGTDEGGGGNVSKVGTPVNNQIGVWTGDGTIEGTVNLTFDSTTFDVNGDIECDNLILGNATTTTGKFLGISTATATSTDITGISGNNPVIRKVSLYIEDDPSAVNETSQCRLSFYDSDSKTEDELLKAFYFNLSYTEVNGNASSTDTTTTIDNANGLVKYDLIRFLGGTAENQRLTASASTTLTFTALGYDHLDNTGVVRVAEITTPFQLYDADSTKEIHVTLETFSNFTSAVDVVIDISYQ